METNFIRIFARKKLPHPLIVTIIGRYDLRIWLGLTKCNNRWVFILIILKLGYATQNQNGISIVLLES